MQPSIQNAERDVYEGMWEIDQYANFSPGEQYAPLFDSLVRPRCHGYGTVLDAGCGSGKGAVALQALGYRVELCDLTPTGLIPEARSLPFFETSLWSDFTRDRGFVDYVYCCDVLEHLPTVFVGLALSRMLEKARSGVFLSVALAPDVAGVWAGRPLHLTVQPYDWWRGTVRELGCVTEARDMYNTAIFMVEPRR